MTRQQAALALDTRPDADDQDSFAIWSVKDSFLRYIARLPDGVCEASDDVRRVGGGQFVLPGRIAVTDTIVWTSPATLRFRAHGGLLSVALRDLRLEIGPASGELSIGPQGDRGDRIRLARAGVRRRSASALQVDLALTIDGAGVFGDNYPASEPLDPIHLTAESLPWPADDNPPLPPSQQNG